MVSILTPIIIYASISLGICSNILMVTMGGTKSHKIPFWELAKGLIPKGHNITFISGFPQDFVVDGLEEITPLGLVFYIRNFTNWDLVGARMRGEEPVHPYDAFRYAYETCDALLSDPETIDFMHSGQNFDLLILDGAFPECALGFSHLFKAPYMYLNTVGFYTGSLSVAGNPVPFSVTPVFTRPFTENMNILQRTMNTLWHILVYTSHSAVIRSKLQGVVNRHFGNDVPHIFEMSKNVSFILQNAYATITYPRPYLPNVAEIACIHCKKSKPLPLDLEEFIAGGGDAGFIFVSMGSSVKAANMPDYLRRLFLWVFKQLPHRVLWKWEGDTDMPDLPSNVKLCRWLPQQDLLGHPKIRAFVTHGGLLSMFETIYHGVPIVTLPVFCDHDANAAKAALDGYAIKLDLEKITSESLLRAIKKIIYDPRYKEVVKQKQMLLLDQKETPLERAIYWTEYVLRHRGAKHLQSRAKDLNIIQYYLVDVALLLIFCSWISFLTFKLFLRLIYKFLTNSVNPCIFKKSIKIE